MMDAIYYCLGFVVFWLLCIAAVLVAGYGLLTFLFHFLRDEITHVKGKYLFLFGWTITTDRGFRYIQALDKRDGGRSRHPNSRQKLARLWLHNHALGTYVYRLLGFTIFWGYIFAPCWPWQVRSIKRRRERGGEWERWLRPKEETDTSNG